MEDIALTVRRLNRILDWADKVSDTDLTDGNFFTVEEMKACGIDRHPDHYAAYLAYLSMGPLTDTLTEPSDKADYKAAVRFAKQTLYKLCERVDEQSQRQTEAVPEET